MLLVFAAAGALWTFRPPGEAFGQMDRSGTVGIQNETERKLFGSLLCTCGCPREALDSCTCGFSHQRRDELREALSSGKDIETIKADYAKRFGTAALAVPPNTGSQRWVWIAPLVAIILGAGVVGFVLRRWVKASGPGPGTGAGTGSNAKPTKEPKRADDNKYDDKLDEELKALDRE
jgi:cytochrome c-type biogenesis protein CcmH